MAKEAFDAIMSGLQDALAYAGGDQKRGVTHTIAAVDVANIRKKHGLSRPKFSQKFGLDARALQDWEQGRRRPDRAAALLLKIIEREPEVVARTVAEAEEEARASCP